MIGPVGKWGMILLAMLPPIHAKAAKKAANITIVCSCVHHKRAAAAGAISNELIRTTPTVCSPSAIVITNNVVKMVSRR